MSDATGRTQLIGLNAKRIMELEVELDRMKTGEKPRFAPLRERVVLLLVNGLIMAAMAWVNADNRVATADQGLEKEVVEVQRDVAEGRASDLYDTAEALFVEGTDQGCSFEVK